LANGRLYFPLLIKKNSPYQLRKNRRETGSISFLEIALLLNQVYRPRLKAIMVFSGTVIKEGKTIIGYITSGINMTEQPNNESNLNNQQNLEIEKLLIDDLSSFQFHAAYLVYSETFDTANEDAKRDLNQNLEDLKQNKIDAQTFYVNISRYRKLDQPMGRPGKFTVATQRKKDWRMKTQRSERIKRHKK